jgi:hypothetical protein
MSDKLYAATWIYTHEPGVNLGGARPGPRHWRIGKRSYCTKKNLLLCFITCLITFLLVSCGGGDGPSESSSASANSANSSGTTSATITAAAVPDPPADDTSYFQILIANRTSGSHTIHLSVTGNQMPLNSPAIEKRTWLTGGGAGFNDWTRPVFQIVDSATGSSATGANFASPYDVTLDELPADPRARTTSSRSPS